MAWQKRISWQQLKPQLAKRIVLSDVVLLLSLRIMSALLGIRSFSNSRNRALYIPHYCLSRVNNKGTVTSTMKLYFIKKIVLNLLALLIIFYPLKIDAISPISHSWVEVPKSQFGQQLWDKHSVQRNQDESIRVFSKFIPKDSSEITQDILYTMDIDCSEKLFRDVAVGATEFNEFLNKDSEWKAPNGDKLILGVIDQVCTFGDSNTAKE